MIKRLLLAFAVSVLLVWIVTAQQASQSNNVIMNLTFFPAGGDNVTSDTAHGSIHLGEWVAGISSSNDERFGFFTTTNKTINPAVAIIATFQNLNCTNCNNSLGSVVEPFVTFNITPRFTFNTSSSMNCSFQPTFNRTFQNACSPTNSTSHACALPIESSIDIGPSTIYANCTNSTTNVYDAWVMNVNITRIPLSGNLCDGITKLHFQPTQQNLTEHNVSADGQLNANCAINISNIGSRAGNLTTYLRQTSTNTSFYGAFNNTVGGKCPITNQFPITQRKRIINNTFQVGAVAGLCLWANFDVDANMSFAPTFVIDLWERSGD